LLFLFDERRFGLSIFINDDRIDIAFVALEFLMEIGRNALITDSAISRSDYPLDRGSEPCKRLSPSLFLSGASIIAKAINFRPEKRLAHALCVRSGKLCLDRKGICKVPGTGKLTGAFSPFSNCGRHGRGSLFF
jgi:hypothetical protein